MVLVFNGFSSLKRPLLSEKTPPLRKDLSSPERKSTLRKELYCLKRTVLYGKNSLLRKEVSSLKRTLLSRKKSPFEKDLSSPERSIFTMT